MDKTQKTEEKIQHVLDEKINNRLADHGGSAELTGFVDGVASVKFYGACRHCASADDTFQFIVKSSILEEVPEVKDVVLDETVSEDLLEMARKILNGELK